MKDRNILAKGFEADLLKKGLTTVIASLGDITVNFCQMKNENS